MSDLIPSFDNTKAFLRQDSVASFISGGFAGAISRTSVSPFERAKILFQISASTKSLNNANYNNSNGIFKTIAQMYKDEGVKGLFRGNGINCVRIFPYSAVQFYVYQKIKLFILSKKQNGAAELDNLQRLFAGAMCGTASVVATYPLDLVKTRLSVQTVMMKHGDRPPPGFLSLLLNIYKNEGGLLALYRGIWPTTLGVAPYVAINFAVYEQLKEFFPNSSNLTKLTIGAIAGGVAQTLTYPFDLLRRRFQVLSMENNKQLGFQYSSVSNALVTIYRTEGFLGLYKGLTANLFKVVPSMAVSWLSYELIKAQLVAL